MVYRHLSVRYSRASPRWRSSSRTSSTSLQQLPAVIVGALDAEFAKEWLNGARSDAGRIKDKMLDAATYEANKKAVDALTDSLCKSIGEVWGFSQNGAMA